MCLGIPGKVISIDHSSTLLESKIDFGGLSKTVSLAMTPEAKPGDYVIVHVGFAISIIDEHQAQLLLHTLKQLMEDPNEIFE